MRCTHLITAAAVLFTLCSGAALGQTVEEWAEQFGIRTDASYDATRVIKSKAGSFSFKERRAPGKSAMEMNMGGMQGTSIIREDLQKAWFIMHDMGMYREMDMREAMGQQDAGRQMSNMEEVGRETVNGFSARKFKTQFQDQEGKGSGYLWITDDGVPIKMDMTYTNRGMKGERMTMELVDLKMRAQDDSHFELPANIQPMNFGAMMGMAGQMQEQSGRNAPDRSPPPPPPQTEQPTIVDEVSEAAVDEAGNAVESETRSAVRKGVRGLFRRLGN